MNNQFIEVKVLNEKFDRVTLHKINILAVFKVQDKTQVFVPLANGKNCYMLDESYEDFLKRAGTDTLA